MVQAALPMIISGAGALTSAIKNQSHSHGGQRPELPQTTGVLASIPDKKIARIAAKNAKEERLMYLLTQPEIIGLLISLAGIYASQNIKFSSTGAANEGIQAIATMTSVLIGLGYAGVGDLTTMLAAGIAGGVSLSDIIDMPDINLPDIDWLEWIKSLNPFNALLGK